MGSSQTSLKLIKQSQDEVTNGTYLEYSFNSQPTEAADKGTFYTTMVTRHFVAYLAPSVREHVSRMAAVNAPRASRHSTQLLQERLPVIVALHGTDMYISKALIHYNEVNSINRNAWKTRLRVQLTGERGLLELAQKHKIIVIFAQARPEIFTRLYTRTQWQPGFTGAPKDNIGVTMADPLLLPDQPYFEDIADIACYQFFGDPRRCYAVGFSLGGVCCSDMAYYLSHRYAAVCNWCGGIATPREHYSEVMTELCYSLRPKLAEFPKSKRKTPMMIITADRDINRPECLAAKGEFEKYDWPITFIDQVGREHKVYADQFEPIWQYFRLHSL